MIIRTKYYSEIKELFDLFPVVALLGPRQSGKSTLAKHYFSDQGGSSYFDLESERDLARLNEAQLALEDIEGLIVIDEIQRRPNLFPTLRYLVDNKPQKYLILGSASRELIQQSSESLAGRIAYVELPPFGVDEYDCPVKAFLWRGGYPRSIMASSDELSYRWRQEYTRTFIERDLGLLGLDLDPVLARKLWQMVAHYHGQLLNITEIATSLGCAQRTVMKYLDALEGAFVIRRLQPWHENIKKRQVKTPKIYIRDSGLYNTFVGNRTFEELEGSPKLGACWEGFAIDELIKFLRPDDVYFWSTTNGAELDLLLLKDGKRHGFEFKYSSQPTMTKSMHVALSDLSLDSLAVIVPKGDPYPLTTEVMVSGLIEYTNR